MAVLAVVVPVVVDLVRFPAQLAGLSVEPFAVALLLAVSFSGRTLLWTFQPSLRRWPVVFEMPLTVRESVAVVGNRVGGLSLPW